MHFNYIFCITVIDWGFHRSPGNVKRVVGGFADPQLGQECWQEQSAQKNQFFDHVNAQNDWYQEQFDLDQIDQHQERQEYVLLFLVQQSE